MDKIDPLLKNKNYRQRHGRLIFAQPIDRLTGELPENPPAIRERLKPRLYDYSFIMTRFSRQVLDRLLERLPPGKKRKILDLGCGYKPFASLFPGDEYIGVDLSLNTFAEVIADNEQLPFKNNIFDVIIITEVLEHCHNEYQVVKELRRVAKNGAYVYLTLPFLFPLHGVPHDFNRFTAYKLRNLFKGDKIILLETSNNIFASIFIFINMLIRILFGSAPIFYPVYIFNNLLAMAAEKLSGVYRDPKGFIAEYWQYALQAFPIGYSMLVKIKK